MKWWILLFSAIQAFSLPNLEEKESSFVLETRRLEIPGHPFAFNPSIVQLDQGYLLSFRIIPDRKQKYDTRIGLVRLDADFKAVGEAQILETRNPMDPGIPRGEDARLIWVANELYMVYSDCPDLKMTKGGFRMHIGKITFDGSQFHLEKPDRITKYEGENPFIREKSWTPFNYKEELLLSYSQVPHLVFKPLLGSDSCETISNTRSNILWDWGVIRGGTAAELIGDEYLSFFHSTITMASFQSDSQLMPHYFMGAYTFSSKPPFEITKVSSEPIIANGFYSGEIHQPYHVPIRCIFPCGYVADKQFIWVVYGRQDHESWVVKLDKEGLINSLKPVEIVDASRD